ncbi:Ig-like domain-containing protein [Candidatus Uhrbacteria bacterium]|nr:Ig-like domain-containing protein [Candidatus Uhrbacteria bacterium]
MSDNLDPRHNEDSRPFVETSRAVSDLANAPSEHLDPVKKSSIRDQVLVSAAKKLAMPTPEMKEVSAKPAKKGFRLPVWPTFAVAGLAAVLILAILVTNRPIGLPGSPSASIVRALSIPAAHAADAFTVLADKSDAAGMDTDTAFTVTSKVDISTDQLRQALRIVPPVDVSIESTGDNTFKITPSAPLATGEVYQVTIATEIVDGNESQAREFSWALQTKNDFRLLSSIPRDGASRVPTNTGIEFKLSRDGWVDPAAHFSITPSVQGEFRTQGRYLTFIPKKPLAEGTRYEVVLKKGFNVAGSDLALKDDVRLRFETDAASLTVAPETVFIPIADRFHFEPAKELTIELPYGVSTALQGVRVTGYRLTQEEAKALLEKRLAIPSWTVAEKLRYADFEKVATKEAFKVDAKLIDSQYQKSMVLPPIAEPGYFAVRLDPVASRGAKPSWTFFQVNNAAAYLKADKDTLLVWTVNPSTNRPLSNLPLRLNGKSATTDANGLGRLETPSVLTNTTTKAGDVYPVTILEVGEGAVSSLMVLRKTYDIYAFDFGNQDQFISDTVGYLYTDRPLYRASDELRFFGLAQDRNTQDAPSDNVTIRLRKSSYWFDFGTGEEKVYQEQVVDLDAAGRLEGRLAWDELSQGYYTIELRRNNRTISSRSIEVREFVKPAYSIEVIPDHESIYTGEALGGTVRVRFFDGTPVPRQKLELTATGLSYTTLNLETDSNGSARFELKPSVAPCGTIPPDTTILRETYNLSCYPEERLMINVRPVSGEEGEIRGSASVAVRRSALGLNVDLSVKDFQASATIKTWRHAFEPSDMGRSNPWPNHATEVTVIPWHWERIESGFYYDTIEKKNIQQYRYEARYEPAIRASLTTDGSGQTVYNFPMEKGKDYVLFVDGRDDAGRLIREVRYMWEGGYGSYARTVPDENKEPSLAILPESKGDATVIGYALDQTLAAEFRIGNDPIDVSKTPGILYLLASRGLKDVKVLNSNQYPFRFENGMIPNVEVYGVTWQNGRFVEVRNTAFFRASDRELEITSKTDKERYAPGENVNVTVTAKLKSTGQTVRDLKFAYSAVDKALLALSYDEPARPLDALYGFVADGFIFSSRSHEQVYEGFGGAEKGGGGGDALRASARKNFKDTAAFGIVNSDSNGTARFSFQAPDNITGWRLEMIGLSGALEAGAGRVDVNVSKPVFVEAVLPPRLLVTDKPVLKLRAFGAGLPEGAAVTFVVDAPSLGLREQRVTGKALEPSYVAIDKLLPGRHKVVIGVESSQGSDALERELTIDTSRFFKDEFFTVDAAPGSSIPELGQPEAEVVLTAKNRAILLPYLYDLVWSGSARSDAKLAQRYALSILRGTYGEKLDFMPSDEELAAEVAKYQAEEGAMYLLPYGSTDLELTAEVAASLPELIDRKTMAASLWLRLDEKSASREVQLQALSGLAALGEPVLPSLQTASEIKDLSWREQLAIARGLNAAGDRERARTLLETLMQRSQDRDTLTWLEVSKDEADNIEASADAAAIAASLAHPKAAALRRYVDSVWSRDAFPVLAKARYLKAVLPTVLDRDIKLTYTLGTDDNTILFKDEPVKRLTLTAAEARNFRVTSVDGPVGITFLRRTPGKPVSKPEVSVSRRYTPADNRNLSDLREGDSVAIELLPNLGAKAIDGCYQVTDYLPGGWQPLVGNPYEYSDWYPYESGNGYVSFMVCGRTDASRTIRYTARVVSRGTFTAEAPLIQHSEYPSISSVGKDETVIVK